MRGAKPRPNSCMQDWSCWPPTTPRWSCGEAKHHNRETGEQQPVRFTAHQLHSPYLPPRKIRRIATAVQEAHGCPGSTQPSRRDLHSTGTSTWQGVGVRALRATVKLPHGPAHFAWSPASRLTGSPFLPMRAESFAPTGSALGGALHCSQRLSRTFHNPEGRSTPSTIWPSRTATALNITGTIPFAKRGGNDSIARTTPSPN